MNLTRQRTIRPRRSFLLGSVAIVALLTAVTSGLFRVHAQNRMTFPIVSQDSGHVALGLAIRRLNVRSV